jgi:chromosome segregation ATPase
LRSFCNNFVVAEDLDEARRLLESLDDGVIVVTTNGDYLSRNLLKGGGTEPSKVELISERSQISEELTSLGKEIEKATESLSRLKDDSSALSDEVTANLMSFKNKTLSQQRKQKTSAG